MEGQRPHPPRIVLCGCSDENNPGDELTLYAILTELGCTLPGFEACVLSMDPQATARWLGVPTLDKHDVHAIAELLSDADVLVLAGWSYGNVREKHLPGALINGIGRNHAYCLMIFTLALSLEIPVEVVGMSLQPLHDSSLRRQLRWALRSAAHINVRDTSTLRLLAELGVDRSVELSPDPITLLPSAARRNTPMNEPLMGLLLGDPQMMDGEELRQLLSMMVRLSRRIGGQILAIPLVPESLSRRRAKWSSFASELGAEFVVPAKLETPFDVRDAIARCSLVLAVGHHAVILAAASGVPCAAVHCDLVADSSHQESGTRYFNHNLNLASPEETELLTRNLWEHRETERKRLLKIAGVWRAQATNAIHGLARRIEIAASKRVPVSAGWKVVSGRTPSCSQLLARERRVSMGLRDWVRSLGSEITSLRRRLEVEKDRTSTLEQDVGYLNSKLDKTCSELGLVRSDLQAVSGELRAVLNSPYWRAAMRLTSSRSVKRLWLAIPSPLRRSLKRQLAGGDGIPSVDNLDDSGSGGSNG